MTCQGVGRWSGVITPSPLRPMFSSVLHVHVFCMVQLEWRRVWHPTRRESLHAFRLLKGDWLDRTGIEQSGDRP